MEIFQILEIVATEPEKRQTKQKTKTNEDTIPSRKKNGF